jgi:hypothetical protein
MLIYVANNHIYADEDTSMTQYRIATLVGSLRSASLNRKLAQALFKLTPAECSFHFIEIGDLPLYNQDEENAPSTRTKWPASKTIRSNFHRKCRRLQPGHIFLKYSDNHQSASDPVVLQLQLNTRLGGTHQR